MQGKEFGHIYVSDDGRINIHVKRWAALIAEAEWRYTFFREQLNLQISTDDAMRYLREKHSQHLPTHGEPADLVLDDLLDGLPHTSD